MGALDIENSSWVQTNTSLRIVVWCAFGLFLHILEGAFLPRPFPFRLGLANLAALLALRLDGPWVALRVSFWRTLLGSLLYGTFLQMTFFMSLTGAVGGTLAMIVAVAMCDKWFSHIGISLVGAGASMLAMFAFSMSVLGNELRVLFPIFLALGLTGGLINGILACCLLERRSL